MPLATFAAQAIGQFEDAVIDPHAVTQGYTAAANLTNAKLTRTVAKA